MGLNIFLTGLIVFALMLVIGAIDKHIREDPSTSAFTPGAVSALALITGISIGSMFVGLIVMVWS